MSWRQLGPTSPGARSSGSRFTTAHSREAHLHQKPLQYNSTDDDEVGPVIDQDGNDEGFSHSSPSKMSVVAASGLPSRIAADDVASARPSDRHHPYLSRGHRPRSSMPMMSRAASGDELRLPPLTTLITATSSRDASSTSSPSPASYDSFSVPSPSLMTSQSYNTRAPSPTSSVAASPPLDWRRGGQADEAASTSSASSNPLRVQLPPLASLSIAQASSTTASQRPNISSSKSLSAILPDSATGGSLSNLSPSLDGVLAQGPRLPPIMSSISPRAIPSPNSSLNDASLMESDRLSMGENEVSQSSFGPVRTRNAGSTVHHEANRSRKSTPTYSYGGSAPAHVQSHRSHLSTSASHHPSYDRPSLGLLQDIFVQAFQLNDEYFGGGRGARQLPSLRDKGGSALLMMIRQEVEILAQRDPQLADQLAYDAGLAGPQSPPVEPEPFAPFQAKRNRVRSSTSSSDVDHPFQHRMQQSYFGKHGVHDRRAGEDDDGDVAAMGDYSTTRGQPLLPPLHSQHYHHHHQLQQQQQQQQQQHFSQSQYNQVQRPSSSSPRQPQHFTAPIASEPSSSPHASSSAGNLVRTQSKPNASSQPPKRVRKRKDEAEQSCLSCSATETPEWRKGPTGPRTLCNACGLLFAKQSRRREQDALARGDRPLKGRASAQDEMTEEEKQINLQELRLAVNARSLGTAGPSTMATTTTTVTTATPPFVAPAPAGVAPPADAPHPLYARQHSPPSSRLNSRLPPPSLPGSGSSTRWHESPDASARRHQYHSRSFPPPHITMSRDVSSESIIGNTRRHPLPPSSFEQEEHDELAEDVAMT